MNMCMHTTTRFQAHLAEIWRLLSRKLIYVVVRRKVALLRDVLEILTDVMYNILLTW